MINLLHFDISAQPDNITCGPTSLQAVYRYYSDNISLDQVIQEVHSLPGGGTLAVMLGCHALKRGYDALIYSYNLQLFDPTWFRLPEVDLRSKLLQQKQFKNGDIKLGQASNAYLEFLDLGGKVFYTPLNPTLMRTYLTRQAPILTGLSSTYLYGAPREFGPNCDWDDVRGEPAGHFVVLCGYDREERRILVADPLRVNPFSPDGIYHVETWQLINAILLGMVTYDANLLIIRPGKGRSKS